MKKRNRDSRDSARTDFIDRFACLRSLVSSAFICVGLLYQAASLVFLPAAARAGIVATGLMHGDFGVGCAHDFHEFLRRLPGIRQLGKLSKIRFAMDEKLFQARTQVIQSLFTVRRLDDAVFGAAAIAHAQYFALPAVARQTRPFFLSEVALSWILDHFREGLLVDITDLVFRQNVVVARIKIAVMLDNRDIAAGFTVDAKRVFHS